MAKGADVGRVRIAFKGVAQQSEEAGSEGEERSTGTLGAWRLQFALKGGARYDVEDLRREVDDRGTKHFLGPAPVTARAPPAAAESGPLLALLLLELAMPLLAARALLEPARRDVVAQDLLEVRCRLLGQATAGEPPSSLRLRVARDAQAALSTPATLSFAGVHLGEESREGTDGVRCVVDRRALLAALPGTRGRRRSAALFGPSAYPR